MPGPFEIFRKPLNLYRQVGGSYINGRWVEGGENVIPITASVQPARGEDLQSVPEGRRERIVYALFTSTPILLLHDSTNPDQIEIYGERYEIVHVEIWQNNPPVFGIVNHYKFLAMALEAIN